MGRQEGNLLVELACVITMTGKSHNRPLQAGDQRMPAELLSPTSETLEPE